MKAHILYECSKDEENGGVCLRPGRCNWCDGGLAWCTVCNGAEGSLASECPGVKLSSKDQESIYDGILDFKNDRWIVSKRRVLEFSNKYNPAPPKLKSCHK